MSDIPDRGPRYNGVVWFLTALAVAAVVMRVLSRTKLASSKMEFGIEDWLVVVAIIIDIAGSILFSMSVAAGTGRHMVDIPPANIPWAIEINIIATNVAFYGAELAKTATALLLIRIFRPRRIVAAGLLGGALLENVSVVICTILFFTQCSPVEGTWNLSVKAKCLDPMILIGVGIFSCTWSAFLDLVFAIYACAIISKLNMHYKKKIILCAILGTGFFVCATQIYKITKLKSIKALQDYTWAYGDALFWNTIQAQVMIIASCVPTLRPCAHLVRTQASSIFSELRSKVTSTVTVLRTKGTSKNSSEKGEDASSGSGSSVRGNSRGIGKTVEWNVQVRARSEEEIPVHTLQNQGFLGKRAPDN